MTQAGVREADHEPTDIRSVCGVRAIGAVPATAQTPQQLRLKGVTEVWILIQDLHASCGITRASLTTAVNKALLDNGVMVRGLASAPLTDDLPTALVPTLYVNVNTMEIEANGPCVSNVRATLGESRFVTLSHSAQPVFGEFVLAESGRLSYSGRFNHGQQVRDAVFDIVEEIVVDIRVANQ